MKTLFLLLFSSALATAQLPSGFGVRTIGSREVTVIAHKTPQSAGIVVLAEGPVICTGTCLSIPANNDTALQGVLVRVKYTSAGKTWVVKRLLQLIPLPTIDASGETRSQVFRRSFVGYFDTGTWPDSVLDVTLEEVPLEPKEEN